MTKPYRLVVLADIHGNLSALEAVLADLEPDQPLDRILARLFLEEAVSGKDVTFDFFRAARRAAESTGLGHLPYIPVEIWARVEQEFLMR